MTDTPVTAELPLVTEAPLTLDQPPATDAPVTAELPPATEVPLTPDPPPATDAPLRPARGAGHAPAPPPRPFDAVLTDLDGVIRFYDMSRLAALERAAGLPEGATAEIAFAPETDLPLMLGRIGKEEWVAAISSGLAEHRRLDPARGRALGFALAESGFWADQEVVELLGRARARVPVSIVTNATPWLDDDLARLGLTGLVDDVVGSAAFGLAKPDRRIYELAAERVGAAVSRCLFVDDRQENVDAAVALGMTGVLYRRPDDLREALAPLLA
ncbi:HAD-IA family hydrolase [Streptomyces longispororuber]|uniref:HAD family hydrolase n=2 Tax=Streptomyces longispororuber TaxID=68230 RepID=UPI0033CAA574